MTEFYRLLDELEIPEAWYLGSIIDNIGVEHRYSAFRTGQRFEGNQIETLTVEIHKKGNPVDFRLTAFGIPIANKKLGHVVEGLDPAGVQRFSIQIGQDSTNFEILNVIRTSSCLDFERAKYMLYPDPCEEEPEKSGKVRWISDTVIKPELVRGQHIFRLAEWPIVIIVSRELKEALEARQFTGLKFQPV